MQTDGLLSKTPIMRSMKEVEDISGDVFHGKDNMVKREKGLRWMPWRIEAKKAVVSCEKRRGGAHIQRSVDSRMG